MYCGHINEQENQGRDGSMMEGREERPLYVWMGWDVPLFLLSPHQLAHTQETPYVGQASLGKSSGPLAATPVS